MLNLDKQNQRREQYRAEHAGWQPATERFADTVRRHIQPDSRVLDIGCGRGGLVEQLTHPLSRIVGIDPDWQSLREHRLPLPRVAGVSGALPFADNSFDVAYAAWVLEHLAQPAADFREISRVLRPGAVFVFITPNSRHPLIQLNRVFGRIRRLQTMLVQRLYARAADDTFPTYYRATTHAALQQLATDAGFGAVTLYAVADPTYLAFSDALFRLMCRLETWLPPDRKVHLVGTMRKM